MDNVDDSATVGKSMPRFAVGYSVLSQSAIVHFDGTRTFLLCSSKYPR